MSLKEAEGPHVDALDGEVPRRDGPSCSSLSETSSSPDQARQPC